jgi:hypothetical protein
MYVAEAAEVEYISYVGPYRLSRICTILYTVYFYLGIAE